MVVLYHYTDELAFRNVGNLEQTAAQLFASLVDERAHFGKGLYATQHEPADARLKCDVKRSCVELWVEGFVIYARDLNCAGVGLASSHFAEQLFRRRPVQSQT